MEPQQYCAYDGYPIVGGICHDCLRREEKAAQERNLKKRREQEQKAALNRQKEEARKQKKTQEKIKRQTKNSKERERLRNKQNSKTSATVQSSDQTNSVKNFISGVCGLLTGYLGYKVGIHDWDLQTLAVTNSSVDAIVGFGFGVILALLSSTIRKITWGLLLIGVILIGYRVFKT